MTLEEARQWLRERVDKGERCPCCTQYAKIYRRKINADMVRGLIQVWRKAGGGWCHIPTTIQGYNHAEFSLLRYWGLIEEAGDKREDGGRAGYWRITHDGQIYVHGLLSVPKYALVYNARCLGLEGEPTSIHDAIGTRFDYTDLMNGE